MAETSVVELISPSERLAIAISPAEEVYDRERGTMIKLTPERVIRFAGGRSTCTEQEWEWIRDQSKAYQENLVFRADGRDAKTAPPAGVARTPGVIEGAVTAMGTVVPEAPIPGYDDLTAKEIVAYVGEHPDKAAEIQAWERQKAGGRRTIIRATNSAIEAQSINDAEPEPDDSE